MIEVKVEAYCQDCPGFAPYVSEQGGTMFFDNTPMKFGNTIVRCEHESKCKEIVRRKPMINVRFEDFCKDNPEFWPFIESFELRCEKPMGTIDYCKINNVFNDVVTGYSTQPYAIHYMFDNRDFQLGISVRLLDGKMSGRRIVKYIPFEELAILADRDVMFPNFPELADYSTKSLIIETIEQAINDLEDGICL